MRLYSAFRSSQNDCFYKVSTGTDRLTGAEYWSTTFPAITFIPSFISMWSYKKFCRIIITFWLKAKSVSNLKIKKNVCVFLYKPIPEMLGSFLFLFEWNEMKTKRHSNHTSQYFIHNRTLQIFKWRIFTLLSTKWAHFKIRCLLQVSKKLAQGQQRAEKAKHVENIQLGEYRARN